jgi:hypothetical protein
MIRGFGWMFVRDVHFYQWRVGDLNHNIFDTLGLVVVVIRDSINPEALPAINTI